MRLHEEPRRMISMNPRDNLRSIRHVRPVQPLHFPVEEPWEEHLGQSKRHFRMCALLREILAASIDGSHSHGADQYVYFDASAPKRCLAPDGFVKLNVPDEDF